MHDIVIGVDLGGTNIKAGAVSYDGRVLFRCRTTTEGHMGPAAVVDRIAQAIRDCLAGVEGGRERTAGVCVGSPGPLDLKNGVVLTAPNLPGWVNVPLRAMVEERVGLPCVVENDANAAALGEQWVGAGSGADSLVLLTLGTGIGGGIVLNGKIWHGFTGVAAEIGHMSINPDGPACNCGGRGCIEAYASATAMVRRMREAIAAGRHSSLASKGEKLTARDIYEACVAGDQAALENMHTTGFYLGVAIANILNVLNPEVVVLSGGVTAAGDLLLRPIQQTVREHALEAAREGVRICFSALGDDAGVIGAARSFMTWDIGR